MGDADSNTPILGAVAESSEPLQSMFLPFSSSTTGVPAPSTADPARGRIPYGGDDIFESLGSTSSEPVARG
jgi:hypothetical protein